MLETRATLLIRIRDPKDASAWTEFVRLYAPLLHAYAMKSGIQDADAADLTQDTLRLVLRAAPEFVYEPTRGSFRGWLLTIARNQVRKFQVKNANRAVGTGDSQVQAMLADLPGPTEELWDREYQLHLFYWAAHRVKPEFRENSWQAFWQSVVHNQAIEDVAAHLKMTPGAIYIARSRITARIRQEIQNAEGAVA